ncbi:hypothetical protein BQ8794_300034 [Mesorhizobium prunaredense]|uniref:Uncharacterized protein n=1 Tax=Mesorhizobium prunaredense TaxID=1631249 RepID=A0A1R3VB56_9HYPH|nr:hypothetical protein BQ8794_300034 [Mesorhizobium prunaredense]
MQISFSFARVPARAVVLEPPKWENRDLYSRSVAVPQRFWKDTFLEGSVADSSTMQLAREPWCV